MRSTLAQRQLTDELLANPGVDGNILILDKAWRRAVRVHDRRSVTRDEILGQVREVRKELSLPPEPSIAAE